jgi:hypothetical protein
MSSYNVTNIYAPESMHMRLDHTGKSWFVRMAALAGSLTMERACK